MMIPRIPHVVRQQINLTFLPCSHSSAPPKRIIYCPSRPRPQTAFIRHTLIVFVSDHFEKEKE
jgi:hypothetical protein